MQNLAALAAPFFPSLAELGEFEPAEVGDLPPAYKTLLAHDEHMTVAVEAYHGASVDVRVIESAAANGAYSRASLLVRRTDGAPIQFGIMRIDLDPLAAEVRREVVQGATPLGRILIRHNVLRKVQLDRLWRVKPAAGLRNYLQLGGETPVLFGRTARIVVADHPAVELLEIPTA